MKKLLLLAIIVVSVISCSTDTVGTSSDVDVELATLKGAVLTVDESPVEGALISLYSNNDTIPINSKISSAEGEYTFDSVAIGSYKITASLDDSIYAILQEIEVKEIVEDFIAVDTLWLVQPGTIVGSVLNYDGNGVVWVYIPGTSFIATVDSSGDFIMSGVAPDSNYTVMFDRYGYSSVAISGITVASGDTTYLEPQSMTPNLYPQGLATLYDSINNTILLTWKPMARDDIEGYVVSRKNASLSAVKPMELNTVLITDTLFIDTLHDTLFSKNDTVSLQYQVQGQTVNFGERTGYSLPVIVNAVIQRDSSDYKSIISTTPVEGDILKGLEPFDITWNYTGKIDTVEIFITLDGGQHWNPISGKIENKGLFRWMQVENAQSSTCQLKIVSSENSAVIGMSDLFSIAMTPVSNLLENGDFENGFKGWVPNVHNYDAAVEATMEVDSGVLYVNVDTCDEMWKVRIYQYPISPIYSTYEYELSFRAKASKPHLLNMNIHSITGDYEHYGEANQVIDTAWADYKFYLSPAGDPSGKNTVISFSFGSSAGEFWLDDVRLKIVGVK